ncbi:hypothetical protein FKM82_013610 [Ascaphus truei]
MAPCKIGVPGTENNMGKEIRKMRKPVVEKMRRDRINSSIEQLKTLLEKEFQKHELPSKPEKADILEMTVSLLRQQLQRAARAAASSRQTSKEGFATCMKDTLQFLPSNKQTESQIDLLSDSHRGKGAAEYMCHSMIPSSQTFSEQPTQEYDTADLWRPW